MKLSPKTFKQEMVMFEIIKNKEEIAKINEKLNKLCEKIDELLKVINEEKKVSKNTQISYK